MAGLHNMTVIPPDPGFIVIEVVRRAAQPGLTKSDVFRWAGVAVGVAGAVLATPHGIASLWRAGQRWHRKAMALGRRLLRRPPHTVAHAGLASGSASTGGSARGFRWQPWLPRAGADLKTEILHQQVDSLLVQVGELNAQMDQNDLNVQAEIRKTEERIVSQIRQLESDIRGERTQASQVDARGFGPIAFGILLTGIPDELAGIPPEGWLGWLIVAIAGYWIIRVSPRWLRDYQQALKDAR
jgi:hypothetical protein